MAPRGSSSRRGSKAAKTKAPSPSSKIQEDPKPHPTAHTVSSHNTTTINANHSQQGENTIDDALVPTEVEKNTSSPQEQLHERSIHRSSRIKVAAKRTAEVTIRERSGSLRPRAVLKPSWKLQGQPPVMKTERAADRATDTIDMSHGQQGKSSTLSDAKRDHEVITQGIEDDARLFLSFVSSFWSNPHDQERRRFEWEAANIMLDFSFNAVVRPRSEATVHGERVQQEKQLSQWEAAAILVTKSGIAPHDEHVQEDENESCSSLSRDATKIDELSNDRTISPGRKRFVFGGADNHEFFF
ncbi:hypothetical protein OE88DRAFT_1726494 [Heliocybe sulcata]|uniref:Uncharacterized protein n=1 Tax=Heliocybe sulcata TaxID=5364 RepID=A0A5C3NA34_9AGAM|nr:hypothetical protein OE88DRAFT_1726494 [Heliocybe sulcata]